MIRERKACENEFWVWYACRDWNSSCSHDSRALIDLFHRNIPHSSCSLHSIFSGLTLRRRSHCEQFFYFLITYGVCKKTKYCNRISEKNKNSLLLTNVHNLYVLEDKTSQKKKFPSVYLSVCRSVWMYARTWTFHVDTITFEGVSGSKKNLMGVFYVWNIGLVLKSKVISWSWSWSWFWTEFWFSQKLCGATPNFVDIFSI